MNHPSEWSKFYDDGVYRYRHKGTGVLRDSLMAIGKIVKKAKEFARKGCSVSR